MKNKTLILIPALAVALAVSGCGKKETPKPVVNNTNAQQMNENANTNANLNKDTNPDVLDVSKTNQEDIKNIPCSDIDYKGEVIKEEDGWKRYINENLGIEFRFKDDEDKMNINSDRGRIDIGNKYKLEPYIYINIIDTSIYYSENGNRYNNLREFVEAWGAGIDFNEIISMEETKNDNNLNFLEVLFKITPSKHLINEEEKYKPKSFEMTIYYTEYNRPPKCHDDYGTDIAKKQSCISIQGVPDLQKQIVDSLKFID